MSRARASACTVVLAALASAAAATPASAPITMRHEVFKHPYTGSQMLRLVGTAGTKGGQHVDVLMKECGYEHFRIVGGAQTAVGGAWRAEVYLENGGTFRARWRGVESRAVKVRAPLLPVATRRPGTRHWFVIVSSWGTNLDLSRRPVELQRLADSGWVRVRRANLRRVEFGNYEAVFAIPTRGLTMRVLVPDSSARPCFRATAGTVFRS